MDANIKTAASLLRNASYNLQSRIRELQSDENSVHRHEIQEEKNIRSDLFQTEYQLAHSSEENNNSQYLARHTYDLFKRRKLIKEEALRKIRDEEKEIRSLQAQINKLNELAHMLEMWK